MPLLLAGVQRSTHRRLSSGIRLRRLPLDSRARRCDLVDEAVQRHHRDALAAALAHSHRLVRLAVTPDNDVRDLLQLGVADPLAERLDAIVDVRSDTRGVESAV